MIESLDELALKYGTDKSSKFHNYTRWYERHLPEPDADHEFNDPTLLELGVFAGNSLKMWRDYYRYGAIVGLDIGDCPVIEGTKIYKGDQTDPAILENVIKEIGSPDVIIDDGSHMWAHQIASFKLLWPHVKPGGYYVIEDLHTSYFMSYGEPGEQNCMSFLAKILDDINTYGAVGIGDIRNSDQYGEFKDRLTIYQKTIESIIFYPSIVFIRKSDVN